MALINLKYIELLHDEATSFEMNCLKWYFNADRYPVDPGRFVVLVKLYRQADNLLLKLSRLHQTCLDLANDNQKPYIEQWSAYNDSVDDEAGAYDPFFYIRQHFGPFVMDLPEAIERYAELVSLTRVYSKVKAGQRESVDSVFGDLDEYLFISDDEGNPKMVLESEVPEDTLNTWKVEREIEDIEVEHCLDKYNEFYKRVKVALEMHQETCTPKECAGFILSMFAPVEGAKLTGA